MGTERVALKLFVAAMGFCATLSAAIALGQTPRMVLIDQDAAGPGGSDQMAMMVLLQSPQVKVLGITVVSGDQWETEEVQHALRMLELIHRSDVPVVPGALYPLLHTRQDALLSAPMDGTASWWGAWGDPGNHTARSPYHGPEVVPPLPEGAPTTKPLNEDAAHFLVRQVRAHPHQVTIYAGGPLTNIALALAIDPEFAALSKGIVIMGGSLEPITDDPEFATHPRHEFNFWFDPEAASKALRAHWPRIDLTTVDISVKTRFTREMVAEISRSNSPAAQYISKYTTEFQYLWDELAAAAWIDPKIITKERVLYVDVDLSRGPNYGDALTWTDQNKPQRDLQPVHVQQDLDSARFNQLFLQLMMAPPHAP